MIDELLRRYPLVTDQVDKQELRVILRELRAALDNNVLGNVVEFGCYEGTTSLFLSRVLMGYGQGRQLHVYDSFAGLPAKATQDESPAGQQFQPRQLKADKARLIKHFKQAGLPLPVIHKSWFHQLKAGDVPSRIAFAFLDGDFYDSIIDSLKLIWPRLSPGSIVVVDDYQSEALPGVAKAVDAWTNARQLTIRSEESLAIIHLS